MRAYEWEGIFGYWFVNWIPSLTCTCMMRLHFGLCTFLSIFWPTLVRLLTARTAIPPNSQLIIKLKLKLITSHKFHAHEHPSEVCEHIKKYAHCTLTLLQILLLETINSNWMLFKSDLLIKYFQFEINKHISTLRWMLTVRTHTSTHARKSKII